MIISGTAGSGKSYLIQSLVRAIKVLFNSNKAVQVLCPTGSSANLISGRTIHNFLKIPQYFYTDRSKAVLLLWFLTVLAVCVYTLIHLLC